MIDGQIKYTGENNAAVRFAPPCFIREDLIYKGPISFNSVRVECNGIFTLIPRIMLPEIIKVLQTYVIED